MKKSTAMGIAASAVLALVQASGFGQGARKAILDTDTGLPMKVLVRPKAAIYEQADAESRVVQTGIDSFSQFFVYSQPAAIERIGTEESGWYEIGAEDEGSAAGWIRAKDVMVWKHRMCVGFRYPKGTRASALLFRDRKDLMDVWSQQTADRQQRLNDLYMKASAFLATPGQSYPTELEVLRAIEPLGDATVNINENFYLMPVTEYRDTELAGGDLRRFLKVSVSRVAEERSANEELSGIDPAQTTASQGLEGLQGLEDVGVDLCFCMDMTNSMQEHINKTLEAVREIAAELANDPSLRARIKLGLWGYRDIVEIPGMEWETKNFTETLQSVEEFQKTLETVRAATSGSADYPESLFNGMRDAIQKTAWRDKAVRYLILVGDAPGHLPGEKWEVPPDVSAATAPLYQKLVGIPKNSSDANATTVRLMAGDQNVTVFSIHLRDERLSPADRNLYWTLAEEQFRELARSKALESNASAYWSIESSKLDEFKNVSRDVATAFILAVKPETLAAIQPPAPGAPAAPAAADDPVATSRVLARAATMQFLGQDNEAPNDRTGWTTAEDPNVDEGQWFDVYVMLTKKELSDMATMTRNVYQATMDRIEEVRQDSLFNILQRIATDVNLDPDMLASMETDPTMTVARVAPRHLQALPFRSDIMELDSDKWVNMSPDDRAEFLALLESKLAYYTELEVNAQVWHPLNPEDEGNQNRYYGPLNIEALP